MTCENVGSTYFQFLKKHLSANGIFDLAYLNTFPYKKEKDEVRGK